MRVQKTYSLELAVADEIDRKAHSMGMNRSEFVAEAVMSYRCDKPTPKIHIHGRVEVFQHEV